MMVAGLAKSRHRHRRRRSGRGRDQRRLGGRELGESRADHRRRGRRVAGGAWSPRLRDAGPDCSRSAQGSLEAYRVRSPAAGLVLRSARRGLGGSGPHCHAGVRLPALADEPIRRPARGLATGRTRLRQIDRPSRRPAAGRIRRVRHPAAGRVSDIATAHRPGDAARSCGIETCWCAGGLPALPEMSAHGIGQQELRALPGVRNVSSHVGRALMSDQTVNVNA